MFRILMALVIGAAFSAETLAFTQIEKPTSVKVRAVVNSWERIYTPNFCYPDAISFRISARESSNLRSTVLAASKSVSDYVKTMSALRPLTTPQAVTEAASHALEEMGMIPSVRFADQLVRVYEKTDARKVYTATTGSGGRVNLEGSLIVILDLENSEMVLLTDGDGFEPSRCEE